MKELLKKCGANENYEEKDNLPKNHDGHRVVNDYFDRWVTSFERVIRTRTFKLQLIIRNQKMHGAVDPKTGFNCTVHFLLLRLVWIVFRIISGFLTVDFPWLAALGRSHNAPFFHFINNSSRSVIPNSEPAL